MRIIFIRHGNPNYKDDCLTELGHLQAEAAADRLSGEKIDGFFSSSCGRAVETAEHIAARFGAEVTQLEFMREISWRAIDPEETIPHNGHPWFLAEELVRKGESLMELNWKQKYPFCRSRLLTSIDKVETGFDNWLAQFGYIREGEFYRVRGGDDRTVLLASHAGSSTVVLSHLFNLPPMLLFKAMGPDVTAITEVEFGGADGELISPNLDLMNDARHIRGLTTEKFYGN